MNLAVPHVVRNWHMQQALVYGFQRLLQQPAREDWLSIVGYGPSLTTTWSQIRYPVLTLSGAHDFCLANGIAPQWHADCDPRIHKANFVAYPHPHTTYLMASCCHPATWQYLRLSKINLWHADNGPETQAWLAEHEREPHVALRPGPSIGIAALGIASVLGFKRVRLFGYDSCYDGEELRAGGSEAPYTGEQPQTITVGGVTYVTTENMRRQAEAFIAAAEGLAVTFEGHGLLRAMVRAAVGNDAFAKIPQEGA